MCEAAPGAQSKRAPPWREACMRKRQMGDFVLDSYGPGGFYCEMLRCPATAEIHDRLARMPIDEFARRAHGAEQALYNLGITFTVYSDSQAIDRILPFDAIPRVLPPQGWERLDR